MKRQYFLLLILSFTLVIGCKKQDLSSEDTAATASFKPSEPGFVENDMVLYWNDKIATVLGVGMNQPTRCRLFAIMHIALHDALNNIKPKYHTYALHSREKNASPDAAVAAAGYWVIKGLNRQGSFPIDTWYAESLATVPDGISEDLGKALGKAAADAIIALRAADGFTQVLQTSQNPPNGTLPGTYRQTNVNNVRFVPNWGTVVQPFVITSNAAFRAPGPNPLNSEAYAADFNEIKEKGVRTGSTRTAEESTLAQFWAENRPSLIWNNFARGIITSKKNDAWKTARVLAVLHTALADGINTALESKYHFYHWKPETAIKEAATDGNAQTSPEAVWIPNVIEAPNANPFAQFVAPPIPEYPAGYAMFGGVAEQVLQWFNGSDQVSVSLGSSFLPGTVLQYNSIAKASTDNAISKIHAGWYFRKSVMDGRQMGKNVAQYVIANGFGENED